MTEYTEELPEDGVAYHRHRTIGPNRTFPVCGKRAERGLTMKAFERLKPFGFVMRAVCPIHAQEAESLLRSTEE